MSAAERIAAGRALIGTRFRAQGRDPAHGLDCAGLAAILFGLPPPPPRALHGGDLRAIEAAIAGAGLVRADRARAGDLQLAAAGARQWHLLLLAERGFLHADAALRIVAEVPGAPPWPIASSWRAAGEGEE